MQSGTRTSPRRRRGSDAGPNEEARSRLLDAAITTIVTKGYYRASSNEIARVANVSWGAIQYHFGSREQMLLAVLEREFAQFVRGLADLRADETHDGASMHRLQSLIFDFYARPEYAAIVQIHLNLIRDPDTALETLDAMATFMKGLDSEWGWLVRNALGTKENTEWEKFVFFLLRGVAVGNSVSHGLSDGIAEGDPFSHPSSRALLTTMLEASRPEEG